MNPQEIQIPDKKFIKSAVFALLIIVVVWCGIKSCAGYKPEFDARLSAVTTAEIAVKNRLKAPSTAKFPVYTQAKVTHSGDVYTVVSYVDSQNGFGAILRSYFKVKMRLRGERFEVLEVVVE